MTDYRSLTRPQRRALDRFARSSDYRDPLSRWPEINSAALDSLVALDLIETAGVDENEERLYRITDAGTRVHDEMWRDGKIPHHPQSFGQAEED